MTKAATQDESQPSRSADPGSHSSEVPETQIAALTQRINSLVDHFKTHANDRHSRRGLLMLINKRRSLLDYLRKTDSERYHSLILELGLRKEQERERRSKASVQQIPEASYQPDARARAILRGVEVSRRDLVEAGGTYDLEQVQTVLGGVSRQAVAKRVHQGSLLAVPGPNNKRRYPTAQFLSDGRPIPDLKQVIDALPTANPWAILNFLVAPDPRLQGRAPIALMIEGDLAPVISAARNWGEQGG